ncbi:hypothetical protein ScPMuIL_002675 [Solemya velum]
MKLTAMEKVKDPLLSTPLSEKDGMTISSSSDSERSRVPDGGWGWVVCAGSFLINFILDGTMFSFGVLLLHLLDSFHESKAKTAWVGSALSGMSMLVGPFVSMLLEKYSCRQVTIAGGMLSGTAFIVSIFSPNVEVLILTYGIIAGTGFCMAFVTSIIVVGLYFHEKRAIATGIAMSGSGLGTFAYAYFCEQLLQEFNWQGTVLIMAGIIFNCVVCVETQSNSECNLKNSLDEKSELFEEDETVYDRKVQIGKEVFTSIYVGDKFNADFANSTDLVFSGLKTDVNSKLYCSAMDIKQNYLQQPRFASLTNLRARAKHHPKSILSKDVFYSGSLMNIRECAGCDNQSLSSLGTSVGCHCGPELASSADTEIAKGSKGKCCILKGRLLVSLMLFKEKTFLLLLLTFTTWTVQTVTLTFLPDMAVSKGVPPNQAALLISIIGIFNTAGRILAGFVTDILHFRSINIYTCALLIAATVNFLLPWCDSFALMALCSSVFGFCMACAVSLRTIVLADHLGIEKLTHSFGVVAMLQGVAFMINPPIAGMLFDVFGSYKSPFIMTGAMYTISGLACLVVRFMDGPVDIDEISIDVSIGNTYVAAKENTFKDVKDPFLLHTKIVNADTTIKTGSYFYQHNSVTDCSVGTDSIGTDVSVKTEETLQSEQSESFLNTA